MFTMFTDYISEIFSLGEFHKFAKFSFAKCVYAENSPKFPSIRYCEKVAFVNQDSYEFLHGGNGVQIKFMASYSISLFILQ